MTSLDFEPVRQLTSSLDFDPVRQLTSLDFETVRELTSLEFVPVRQLISLDFEPVKQLTSLDFVPVKQFASVACVPLTLLIEWSGQGGLSDLETLWPPARCGKKERVRLCDRSPHIKHRLLFSPHRHRRGEGGELSLIHI